MPKADRGSCEEIFRTKGLKGSKPRVKSIMRLSVILKASSIPVLVNIMKSELPKMMNKARKMWPNTLFVILFPWRTESEPY